jgi:hypothetical protein
MAFDTGMSKEGKKIFKSTDENIQKKSQEFIITRRYGDIRKKLQKRR